MLIYFYYFALSQKKILNKKIGHVKKTRLNATVVKVRMLLLVKRKEVNPHNSDFSMHTFTFLNNFFQ